MKACRHSLCTQMPAVPCMSVSRFTHIHKGTTLVHRNNVSQRLGAHATCQSLSVHFPLCWSPFVRSFPLSPWRRPSPPALLVPSVQREGSQRTRQSHCRGQYFVGAREPRGRRGSVSSWGIQESVLEKEIFRSKPERYLEVRLVRNGVRVKGNGFCKNPEANWDQRTQRHSAWLEPRVCVCLGAGAGR